MKQIIRVAPLLICMLLWLGLPAANTVIAAPTSTQSVPTTILAPIWGPTIQQWSTEIETVANLYGLDPDLIASVVKEESNGLPDVVSRVGAVGLMGVMPSGPGLEWRPEPEELMAPDVNLDWGVGILTEIIRQSGGDFFSALAAYSGGWDQVNSRVTRHYASSVLDNYGRAIAARNGISPDIATEWTVAIQIRHGNIPEEALLILGSQPVSGLQTYGEHTSYNYIDQSGRAFYVRGYAVPVALVVPPASETSRLFGYGDALEAELQARLQDEGGKKGSNNERVLIACLPSLSRLRGRLSTRWFAPSQCPSWHR